MLNSIKDVSVKPVLDISYASLTSQSPEPLSRIDCLPFEVVLPIKQSVIETLVKELRHA